VLKVKLRDKDKGFSLSTTNFFSIFLIKFLAIREMLLNSIVKWGREDKRRLYAAFFVIFKT